MGVRTKVDFTVEVGSENDLDNCLFARELSELLDTMEDCKSETGKLAAAETLREIDLGDIQQPRLVYIESDAELTVYFGGTDTTPIALKRMADPSGTSISGLKAYLLSTVQVTSIHLTNPDASAAVRYRVMVVGDLVSS